MDLEKLVFKHEDLIIELSKELEEIFNSIKNSESILSLKEDWDDEGSLPPKYAIWKSSAEFLANYSKEIHSKYKIIIESPDISPCKDDSIDLSWRTKKARMLINISDVSGETIASYYGDCYNNKNQIENEIKTDKVHKPLANWMKDYLNKNRKS